MTLASRSEREALRIITELAPNQLHRAGVGIHTRAQAELVLSQLKELLAKLERPPIRATD